MSELKNIPFKVIDDYFNSIELTDDVVELDECTTIINLSQFVESHTAILKANSGKKIAMPYYHRLLKLYHLYQS